MGDLWACKPDQKKEWKKQLCDLNPFHSNPTYEGSDGLVIGETSAILRFVARASCLNKCYPEEKIKERALIDWAMDVVDTKINDILGYRVVFPFFGFALKPPNQEEANAECTALLEDYCTCFLK